MAKGFVEINCNIIAKTELAILIYDGEVEVWLPISQLGDDMEKESDGTYTIEVSEWLAKQEGLI